MEAAEHIRLLQITYAAQLADSVTQLDRAEGFEAFLAKRDPKFEGR
jgi:hypothetical protein